MIRKRVPPGGVVEFPVPTGELQAPGHHAGPGREPLVTAGDTPVGGGNKIGRITRAGVFTEFPLPIANSRPYSLSAGPGRQRVVHRGGKIGRITPAGVLTEFPVAGTPGLFGLVGPDGNLWFSSSNRRGGPDQAFEGRSPSSRW